MSYDPACTTLARSFLFDLDATDGEIAELAQTIQDACDDARDRLLDRAAEDRLDGSIRDGIRRCYRSAP